MGILIIIPR